VIEDSNSDDKPKWANRLTLKDRDSVLFLWGISLNAAIPSMEYKKNERMKNLSDKLLLLLMLLLQMILV